mmetsp:Transcript_23146/g.36847  ORF Transcript_23146/g.36847 Transcript_23146/m.36847 type:complete len:116 (+) Transcript_23146:8108-8455(+)
MDHLKDSGHTATFFCLESVCDKETCFEDRRYGELSPAYTRSYSSGVYSLGTCGVVREEGCQLLKTKWLSKFAEIKIIGVCYLALVHTLADCLSTFSPKLPSSAMFPAVEVHGTVV